jgi:hypothetical protein
MDHADAREFLSLPYAAPARPGSALRQTVAAARLSR